MNLFEIIKFSCQPDCIDENLRELQNYYRYNIFYITVLLALVVVYGVFR